MDDISAYSLKRKNFGQQVTKNDSNKKISLNLPINQEPKNNTVSEKQNKPTIKNALSKNAERRQRQKIKRNHTVEIKKEEVQEDVDMLKAMKRLKSGKTSTEDIEGILQAHRLKKGSKVTSNDSSDPITILPKNGYSKSLADATVSANKIKRNLKSQEKQAPTQYEPIANSTYPLDKIGEINSDTETIGSNLNAYSSKKNGCKNIQPPESQVPKSNLNMKTALLNHSRDTENENVCVDEDGSKKRGEESLQWMINPMKIKRFMTKHWENQPLYIARKDKNYYKNVFSCKAFDEILRKPDKPIIFGKNIDITSYTEKEGRETHTPDGGRALAAVVWDYYNNGCSIRIINPQTFSDPVWKLCSILQDFFGSMVGANVYLTPPGTQGFAPHFDDVDVFLLQLEGRKHWRLYEPSEADKLARFSSRNFTQDEIGEPLLETTLEAGDFLYMPRGTIHQGYCLEEIHSLHITISSNQRNTFGDLLENLMPSAVSSAIKNNVEFRKGLPLDFLSYMGSAFSDVDSIKRNETIRHVKELASRIITEISVDNGADMIGKRFSHDTLPPFLSPLESRRCAEDGGERWHVGKAKVVNRVEMEPDTEVRFIRANCARLVVETNQSSKLYYNVDNTREYHEIGEEPNFLELDEETVPSIITLLKRYPKYIKLEELPHEDLAQKMRIAQDLWEKRLLMTKDILEPFKFDDD